MQQRRRIHLNDAQPVPSGDYYKQEVRKTKTGEVLVTRRRDGSKLTITVEADTVELKPYGAVQQRTTKTIQLPATIPYSWLLGQVEVADPYDDTFPWDDGDGWEHALIEAPYYNAILFDKAHNFVWYDRARKHVVVTDASYGGESFAQRFEALRKQGASKQVAREVMADRDRAYVKQIVTWYETGYFTVDLSIEIKIAGKVYEESCGGYENHPADIDYGRENLLYGIIHELEQDGFVVTGCPDTPTVSYAEACRKNRLDYMRRRLHEQDRS